MWPLVLRAVDCQGRFWKKYAAYHCIKKIKDRVHPNPNSLTLQAEISGDHCRNWLGLTKDTWRQLQAELLMQQCAEGFGGLRMLQASKISEDLRSSCDLNPPFQHVWPMQSLHRFHLGIWLQSMALVYQVPSLLHYLSMIFPSSFYIFPELGGFGHFSASFHRSKCW